jgi:predicted RNase H-like HicB family nuclease
LISAPTNHLWPIPGQVEMITYRAMYKYLDDGVHAEVLDFPGAITCGHDLDDARRLLRTALADMAETALQHGEPLPQPNPSATDPQSDLEEPIHLLLQAVAHVIELPQDAPAGSVAIYSRT